MATKLGTFSTPSNSDSIQVNNQRTHRFNIVSTNIVDLVVVRIEYSDIDNIWHNVTSYDCEITENTTTNLIVTNVFPSNFLRFVYVSGTADLEVVYTNYN